MRHILVEVFIGYLLYAFGLFWLIRRYAVRDRLPMAVATLFLPIIGVAAVLVVVFQVLTMQVPTVRPCPPGLLVAEQAAEFHRKRLFGGASEQPRVAVRWAALYEAVIERQSEQVRRVAMRARDYLYAAQA